MDNNSTTLSIKTKKDVKDLAQMRASQIGMPLGTIINVFLREFGRTGELKLQAYDDLSPRGRQILHDMQKEIENNEISGEFDNLDDFNTFIDSL